MILNHPQRIQEEDHLHLMRRLRRMDRRIGEMG